MSRLDSFIRRLQAQRACLDLAVQLIAALPGPAIELGLGNGRTYDHLRKQLADRPIFAFDRQVAAHPDCVPDGPHMVLGELRETLPTAGARIGAPAALIHSDIGSGDAAATAALAAWLGPVLVELLRVGGVVASDQPLSAPGLAALPLPDGVAAGRYFLYRKESAA